MDKSIREEIRKAQQDYLAQSKTTGTHTDCFGNRWKCLFGAWYRFNIFYDRWDRMSKVPMLREIKKPHAR